MRRGALSLLTAAATLLSAGCSQAGTGAKAPVAAPAGDAGRFVVAGVLVDPALDNAQQRYFPDDPRLLGRVVEIGSDRLSIDSGRPCTQVRRQTSERTVADLLAAASQRRNQAAAKPPTAADYGVSAPTGRVATVDYACAGPDSGAPGGIPGHEWTGATGFALADGQRALLWEREAILLLRPAGDAKPDPSFACAKAASVTERAICGDVSLANWDRSVAAAYRLNLEGSDAGEGWTPAEDPAALEASQQAWRVERDRCGAERECLLDRMFEQTDALMRRQY